MGYELENAVEWITGTDECYVTFSQKKYRNKIKKLAETDAKVTILSDEDYTYARIPVSYVKIQKPRKVEVSEERREELSERLRTYRTSVGK